jgi:hypothetical protein
VVRAVTVSPGVNALAMCLLEECLSVSICIDQLRSLITHTHAALSATSE